MRLSSSIPKSKSCYVVATEDGRMPAVPVKQITSCYEQLSFCKRFKPEEKWRIFQLTKNFIKIGNRIEEQPIHVEGASVSVREKLMAEIKLRHDPKLLERVL